MEGDEASIGIKSIDAGLEKNLLDKDNSKLKQKIIIGITVFLLLSIFIVIFLILLTKSSDNEPSERISSSIGEIICTYNIESTSSNTIILSNYFTKSTDFDIEIDGKIIKFSKEYKFQNLNKQKVKYILYKNINMDYMFKDIKTITSVEMISNKTAKILSLLGAFENCVNLISFKMEGFDTKEITS